MLSRFRGMYVYLLAYSLSELKSEQARPGAYLSQRVHVSARLAAYIKLLPTYIINYNSCYLPPSPQAMGYL